MFKTSIQEAIEKVDRLRDEVDDHWQIPSDEALLLAQLVRVGRCRSICEVGTSYGFSTMHLAGAAAEHGGHIHTIDLNPNKIQAAREHLAMAGLAEAVTFHTGDARELLPTLEPARPFDFVFFDAVKTEIFAYLEGVWPKLADHAVLVTDNTLTHAEELGDFISHLRGRPEVRSYGVPVGNGFELSVVRRS